MYVAEHLDANALVDRTPEAPRGLSMCLTMHHSRENGFEEKETIHYSITIWFTCFCSCASSHEDSSSKSSSGQGMGKNGENFGVEPDKSQKQKKR